MTDAELECNIAVVRDYHERVWIHGDLGALADCWSPEAAVEITGFEGSALDTLREDILRYQGAFTEVEAVIHDLIAQHDQVVLNWETSGRHVGPYGSVAATGRVITMTGIDIFRLVDGRIVQCRSLWDGLSVYEQMGVLTAPE
jgi:predicted ester cyclase